MIVLGPGLGNDSIAEKVIQTVFTNIASNQTLIIDGSAITLVAQNAALKDAIPTNAYVVYTPHQMEWQRLSGIPISEQNNTHRNQEAQQSLNATVILKKHHSEIYFSNGEIRKLMVGGPAMATGGMGDTLTGILAAFIAQFDASFEDRIQAAVFTHSKIADKLAEEKYVVLPTDIISHLQSFMKRNFG